MITKCNTENDINILIEYIGSNYKEAIYLFLDAKKYGIWNINVSCWIQREDFVITSVILMYHTGMHIYSRNKEFNVDEIYNLISDKQPTMICAEEKIIKKLSDKLTSYKSEIGYVAKYVKIDTKNSNYNIKLATKNDYEKMAKMLLQDDDIGASYSLDDMVGQIDERISDGYSRSYCMFAGDELIAQASTGAEESNIATIAYVMTNPKYRGRGFGKMIVNYMSNELIKEGFEVFLIYYSEEAARLYLNHGFENVCKYGKLYRFIDSF